MSTEPNDPRAARTAEELDRALAKVAFDERGLVPVVVHERTTGEVRMVAYATRDAIVATLTTGRATFWSRSRGAIWVKGETSGNVIDVREVLVDCDGDCILYVADARGPTCHTGAPTCFFRALVRDDRGDGTRRESSAQTVLAALEVELEARKAARSAKSYTKSLYEAGAAKIADKLREEADELGRALANESDERVASEAADVVYHLLVGLHARGLEFTDVVRALESRMGTSGHAEKASRVAKSGD